MSAAAANGHQRPAPDLRAGEDLSLGDDLDDDLGDLDGEFDPTGRADEAVR